MESSERSRSGIPHGVTDPDGSYEGGVTFVEPGGKYTGAMEVVFYADHPHLDPRVRMSTHNARFGEPDASLARRVAPGDLREFAAALNMAADACERARQSKAA